MLHHPNFIGIGAQRCGTTWLDYQLRQHPQAYLPIQRKEIRYFDLYFYRGRHWYTQFFANTPDREIRAVGEISPDYLYAPSSAHRIKSQFPEARLIAILRNPAERAYSQFGLFQHKGGRAADFESFLSRYPDAFYRGLYGIQLARFLKHFNRDQLLVLIFEEVTADPASALKRVCEFLEIDPSLQYYRDLGRKHGESRQARLRQVRLAATTVSRLLRRADQDWLVNIVKRTGVPRIFTAATIPRMDRGIRAALLEQYEDDIHRLEDILDQSFSRWLR